MDLVLRWTTLAIGAARTNPTRGRRLSLVAAVSNAGTVEELTASPAAEAWPDAMDENLVARLAAFADACVGCCARTARGSCVIDANGRFSAWHRRRSLPLLHRHRSLPRGRCAIGELRMVKVMVVAGRRRPAVDAIMHMLCPL